jgi:6-methylsalicylate decarboxylase
MPTLSHIIDVHSHAILKIGHEAPVDKQPDWSVEKTLSLMDRFRIDACVLSVPDAANYSTGQPACDIARRINESLADIVAKHPTRFGMMACLPGADVDGALEEMAFALDVLKMDGVSTSTNINGPYLGDPLFNAWFQEMDRRALTLFIHPIAAPTSKSVSLGLNVSILEFMFDSTRMITNMVLSGAKRRFSKIKMISTHAGGTIPFLSERIQTLEGAYGAGEGRRKLSAKKVQAGFASFYFDLTAATSSAQLGALLDLVPASQIMMGFDIPFMSPQTIAPAIQDIEQYSFSAGDLSSIAYETAGTLFPALKARMGSR